MAINDKTKPSVAARLTGLVKQQVAQGLNEDVIHAGKRCVIDWMAVTLAGSAEKQAVALERALADELGFGPSRTLSGQTAPMRTAALINGLASHIVEFDDIYAPGTCHPGSPTIAAALSAATGLCRSGSELLTAVVAGYEVSNRVARGLGTEHYRFWHTTGTAGTIGSTAATATLWKLSSEQMSHALATSTTMAAGLQEAFRGLSEIKPLHAGHAADAGFVATGLARNGVIAAADMFEGETGLGNTMSQSVDWERAIGDTDEFTIKRTTVKKHGCCGHIFAALDGALALQKQHLFDVQDIESIRVGGYSATLNVTGNYIADSAASAKFCLPFIVASALVHGSIRLDAYSKSRLRDGLVRDLMSRISVFLDAEIDAVFPEQRSANVWIVLNDGTELFHHQPHRVGDPDLPLNDNQLNDKFLEFATPVIGSEPAAELLAILWRLEEQTSLDKLYAPLHAT